MKWQVGLSGTALNIAATNNSPLRVRAGPGTGKSFAMERRVMRLLEEGVPPRRILVVTFTRTAAADLVRKLEGLGVLGCEAIMAGTLHSFCFSLLAKANVFAFLNHNPRPLVSINQSGVMQVEAAPMLEDLNNAAAFGDKRMRTRRIRAFEAAWARLQSEDPGWPNDPVDRQFQAALLAWLKFHNGMLIGALIPETLRYLRNNPLAEELRSFDHVIIDEYQDLNKAEQVLIDLLAKYGTTAIVGDENQSIYSFRHANPEGIVEFGDTRPHTHDETLNECKRCPRRVVVLADYLIQHNHLAADTVPRLSPCPGNPDGEVHIVQWATLQEEAQGLAAYATHLVSDRGYSPGDILILCPRRLIGYGIRDALQNAGLPAHSFYHEEALESDEAQEAFALLTLLTDREDRVALRFWLGFGSPTWLQGEYRTLRKHCEESGQSPRQALAALQTGTLKLARIGRLLKRFGFLLERLAPWSRFAAITC